MAVPDAATMLVVVPVVEEVQKVGEVLKSFTLGFSQGDLVLGHFRAKSSACDVRPSKY